MDNDSNEDLILSMIISEKKKQKKGLVQHLGIDECIQRIDQAYDVGIKKYFLLDIPTKKDEYATMAYPPQGMIPKTLDIIRANFGNSVEILTDVCVCHYNTTGQCRIGTIKETLDVLGKIALIHNESEVDTIVLSGMVPGQVKYIRQILQDENERVKIFSEIKFASTLYGPFRKVCYPSVDIDKPYHMPPSGKHLVDKFISRDVKEKVDAIMVKPSLFYLDIVALAKRKYKVPIGVFQTSGELSLINSMVKTVHVPKDKILSEIKGCYNRVGVDFIISYIADEFVSGNG